MRRRGRRVAGRADVADYVAPPHAHPLANAVRVSVQMRVVIDERLVAIELIDGDAARTTDEELADRAVDSGDDRRAARREDVQRVMDVPSAGLVEAGLQLGS